MRLDEYIRQVGQKQVAEKLGVTPGLVSHWLNGRRRPSPQLAKKIVAMSPVSWDEVYACDPVEEMPK